MTALNPNVDVNVNVAFVDQLPANFPTLFDAAETTRGHYIDSSYETEYQTDRHKVQLAVASDQITTASIAVLANPTVRRVVRFTVESSGEQPRLPAPDSGDANEVLLNDRIVVRNVETEADGISLVWHVEGEYTYAVIDPSKVRVMAGTQPFLNVTYADTQLADTCFVKGLTSPGSEVVAPPRFGPIKP